MRYLHSPKRAYPNLSPRRMSLSQHCFLRHFPPQDLMSVLYSLTVRLISKPLPSRRSRQQLLSELKQLICVSSSLGAMALQNHSRDVGQSQFTIPNMAVPYHHISVPSHVLWPGNNSMALQNHWRDAGQSQSPELKCDHSEWTNSQKKYTSWDEKSIRAEVGP